MNSKEGERHQALLLAGLGDQTRLMELAARHWEKHNIDVTVYAVGWKDESVDLETKLNAVSKKVDELAQKGPVTLIGCSAGGSAAFNVFRERGDAIQKAISICSRLRAGEHTWRSLEKKSAKNKPFKDSVLLFEERESQIPEEFKKRMMTVSAQFGDQLVPSDTSSVAGAYNIKIPSGEHLLSIGLSLTVFSKPIIDFIKVGPPIQPLSRNG